VEKKSIGNFLAALRKSNGLTQQDIADRLSVSNKTVSKWERDVSSPDIALIPVIAELFGVTCDEILLGERFSIDTNPQNRANKVEKQIKHLTESTVTKFKNISFISILLTTIGLNVMFSTSYAFYAPVIGFGLCMIFITVSIMLASIQLNTAKQLLNTEDMDGVCAEQIRLSKATIYRYFFGTVCANIFVLVLSLPFILFRDDFFVNSVITFETYMSYLPVMLLVVLVAATGIFYLMHNSLNVTSSYNWLFYRTEKMRKMGLFQNVLLVCAFLICLAEFILMMLKGIMLNFYIVFLIFFICFVITTVKFSVKVEDKKERALMIVTGIRNLLFVYSFLAALSGISTWAVNDGNLNVTFTGISYNYLNALIAFCIMLGAISIYLVAKYISFKKTARDN
jgi:transcriptional regulator with XRE-family HTH domain